MADTSRRPDTSKSFGGGFRRGREMQGVLNDILGISLKDIPVVDMLEEVLERIISVKWLTLESRGGIWLVEGASDTLVLKAEKNLSPYLKKMCGRIPAGKCLCGRAASTGALVYSGRVDDRHEHRYEGMTPHGHYCVPVVYGGRSIGVINLYIREGKRRNKIVEGLLLSIANVLAGTLERKRMEWIISHRLEVERALSEASRLFVSRDEPDFIGALKVLGTAVSTDAAAVLRFGDDGEKVEEVHLWSVSGDLPPDALSGLDTRQFPWCIGRLGDNTLLVVPDVEEMPVEAGEEKGFLKAGGVRSFLAVPVKGKDNRLVGLMCFADLERRRAWTEEEGHLLRVASDIFSYEFGRKKSEGVIEHMAYHDHLTGLPNRRLAVDRLDQVLARGRWHGRISAVLLLDLDRFKVVNDTFGHEAGDELIKTVAKRIEGCLREGDTVARLGGDEFLLILQDIYMAEDVAKVVKKVFDALKPHVMVKGHEVFVKASMGASICPYDGEQAEVLIKNADIAMYQAKAQGSNSYRIYSPVMEARAFEWLKMENQLHRAVLREEFFLNYQPLVERSTNRITGMEALIRWDEPSRGLVPPLDFIPVAEQTGIITEIGRWVLANACAQAKRFHDAGFAGTRIAVNLSSKQFNQKDFIDDVKEVLKTTGLDPTCLELELTEGIIMEHTEEVLSTMKRLKDLGVRFSIDDFGTGYSSLSYLKRMPIDMLKIDRSFIQNITNDPDDASIVIAIIRLAHSLKLEVVAEGVETLEQFDYLDRLDCDVFQGYLLSRPLSAEDAAEILARGAPLAPEKKSPMSGQSR